MHQGPADLTIWNITDLAAMYFRITESAGR